MRPSRRAARAGRALLTGAVPAGQRRAEQDPVDAALDVSRAELAEILAAVAAPVVGVLGVQYQLVRLHVWRRDDPARLVEVALLGQQEVGRGLERAGER